MQAIFLFFFWFRIILCAGSIYFSLKIAKMNMVDTWTWIFWLTGFAFILIGTIQTTYYLPDTISILSNYSILAVISSQIRGAMMLFFFFLAVMRSYSFLKQKNKENK